ncbi:SapC family protein, partial [Burkholderia sp. SIMBA_024]|uniref:SapC family protein n=1 Tax=Burkholderia sp. SIMBA_024 TaxID=3085768 RepID=UPI00397E5D4E
PFIFLENRQTGQLTLCIDEKPETVVDGDDRPLVIDGKASPLIDRALEFCKEYHAIGKQTEEFIALLAKHDLLVDRTAQMDKGDGSKIT